MFLSVFPRDCQSFLVACFSNAEWPKSLTVTTHFRTTQQSRTIKLFFLPMRTTLWNRFTIEQAHGTQGCLVALAPCVFAASIPGATTSASARNGSPKDGPHVLPSLAQSSLMPFVICFVFFVAMLFQWQGFELMIPLDIGHYCLSRRSPAVAEPWTTAGASRALSQILSKWTETERSMKSRACTERQRIDLSRSIYSTQDTMSASATGSALSPLGTISLFQFGVRTIPTILHTPTPAWVSSHMTLYSVFQRPISCTTIAHEVNSSASVSQHKH